MYHDLIGVAGDRKPPLDADHGLSRVISDSVGEEEDEGDGFSGTDVRVGCGSATRPPADQPDQAAGRSLGLL